MFSKLFRSLSKRDGSIETTMADLENILILRFSTISEESGGVLAPTAKTTDKDILKVYRLVLSKFRDVANQRNEHIPATNMNFIAFSLLQIYENAGEEFFISHLEYQIDYYRNNGLRGDYKKELNLF